MESKLTAQKLPTDQTYAIKDRCGRDHKVRFTKKRAEVLRLLQEGKSRQEIAANGYSLSIVGVVGWQAKKLGLLKVETLDAVKSQKTGVQNQTKDKLSK